MSSALETFDAGVVGGGVMQWFWCSANGRRKCFVSISRDPDGQRLTWDADKNIPLTRAHPAAHLRIFLKDLARLLGLVRA